MLSTVKIREDRASNEFEMDIDGEPVTMAMRNIQILMGADRIPSVIIEVVAKQVELDLDSVRAIAVTKCPGCGEEIFIFAHAD